MFNTYYESLTQWGYCGIGNSLRSRLPHSIFGIKKVHNTPPSIPFKLGHVLVKQESWSLEQILH